MYVFSLHLNTGSELQLVINFGSEFQTVGAECRKAHFANSVLVKSLISIGTLNERNVRAGWRNVRCRLRYDGVADLVGHHSQQTTLLSVPLFLRVEVNGTPDTIVHISCIRYSLTTPIYEL